jgi:hypothetical protein
MALEDYGSCNYTMHHHTQLGMYTLRHLGNFPSGRWNCFECSASTPEFTAHAVTEEFDFAITIRKECTLSVFTKRIPCDFAESNDIGGQDYTTFVHKASRQSVNKHL